MYRWIPYAFVRIAVLFCSGIALGIFVQHNLGLWLLASVFGASAVAFIAAVCIGKGKTLVAGCLAATALISAGMLNVLRVNETLDPNHLTNLEGKITAFRATVLSNGSDRPRTIRYDVAIDHVFAGGQWVNAYSKSLLYIRKDSLHTSYDYGDVLVIDNKPVRISAPLNPGEFDMQKFQAYRQVYFQVTSAATDVRRIGYAPPSALTRWAITARLWAESVLVAHISSDRSRAVASAFVLGITDGLDNELMSAYAATGAMHVLSVSGLHVGIVYWLLLLLFKPFSPERCRWSLLATSLVVLWAYAFVTGISPSVLRAVVMFSFAAIARAWHHKINIYNILAATACLLLVYDPFMLMSVGFQLSFIAVLGIVAFQPMVYRVWEPTSRVCDEIWKGCAVSIAAQLATLPLCLFYFHQFPNYFLLSNLFMAPGSFIVLVMGILLLIVSGIDPAAHALGWLLEWIIDLLNVLIIAVENLPYSVIANIFITPAQVLVLAVFLVAALIWWEARSRPWLGIAIAMCVIFPILSWKQTLATLSPRITVYAIPGVAGLDVLGDHVARYIGSAEMTAGMRQTSTHRITLRSADRVMALDGATIRPGCDLYVWQGRTIVRVYGPWKEVEEPLQADLVLVSNNAVRDMERFCRSIVAKCYVIDSSNSRTVSDRLIRQAATLAVQVHNVWQSGAFDLRL